MLNRERGSILIEGLVAILIFSIGVLALMGMQVVSIKQGVQAKYRNDAGLLAAQIISQIMVDQQNIAKYDDGSGGAPAKTSWLNDVKAALPNGTGSVTYVDTPLTPRTVTVTVGWRAPDEPATTTHQYVASARIMQAVN